MLPIADSAFEAEHFGGKVWRYTFCNDPGPAGVAAAAVAEKVKLVMCRVPAEDAEAAAALTAAGFRLIERLVTFQRAIEPVPDCSRTVVPACTEDRDACVEIAVAALRQDRYHADPLIDDRVADQIKAAWVCNNLAGRADVCLVARDAAGRTVGFNQLLRGESDMVIDLIAVSPAAQHQGYGRALVAEGLRAARGANAMRVGTQAANRQSLAFYRSVGFKTIHQQATYHLVPS